MLPIPSEWQQFEIRYRYRKTLYDSTVNQANGGASATQVILDGVRQLDDTLPPLDDHKAKVVQVIFHS